MKLFLIVLLFLLSYHCSNGYPVTESELSKDLENATSVEFWLDGSNETTSNDSSPLEMHGNKVVKKVKEGIKTVKDKLKDGYNKVKDKIKDFKDKIGSKGGGSGGGSGGGYYRDKYDRDYDKDKYNRDYDRDRYDRDYRRKDKDYISGGPTHPDAVWIVVAIGIVFGGGGFVFVIIMKLREISKRKKSERTLHQSSSESQ